MDLRKLTEALQTLPESYLQKYAKDYRISEYGGCVLLWHPDMIPMAYNPITGRWCDFNTHADFVDMYV